MTTTNDAPAPAPSGSGVREAMEEARFALFCSDMRIKDRADQALRLALASLASDASPRGEASAWRWTCAGDSKPLMRLSGAPLMVAGDVVEVMPLYPPSAPAPAPAEVWKLVDAVNHLSAVSDGVWVQGVSDSEMALLSTAWKRVDAAIAALASPAPASEREGSHG